MSERKRNKLYSEEFKRQAVKLLIKSGKPQAQLARELGCGDMSLSGWKRKYLKSLTLPDEKYATAYFSVRR